jgi:SAM-dependent methyltransferase
LGTLKDFQDLLFA